MGAQSGHVSAIKTLQVCMGGEVFTQRTPVGLEDCLLTTDQCLFQSGCAGRHKCQYVSLGWSIGGVNGEIATSPTHSVRSGCDLAGVCLAPSIRVGKTGAHCHSIATMGQMCSDSTGPLVKRKRQTMGFPGLKPREEGCP